MCERFKVWKGFLRWKFLNVSCFENKLQPGACFVSLSDHLHVLGADPWKGEECYWLVSTHSSFLLILTKVTHIKHKSYRYSLYTGTDRQQINDQNTVQQTDILVFWFLQTLWDVSNHSDNLKNDCKSLKIQIFIRIHLEKARLEWPECCWLMWPLQQQHCKPGSYRLFFFFFTIKRNSGHLFLVPS